MMFRILLLLLPSLTCCLLMKAQGGKHCLHSLYGVVSDSSTLEPLLYANVSVSGTTRGSLTGKNGEYRIEGLCDGEILIRVSHIGCGTKDFHVTISENTHFDIRLPHSESHLDTVLVEDKHPGPKPTVAAATLSGEELERQSGVSLADAIKDITGVNTLRTGSNISKPVIHGMHSNRLLILNNGVRQESQQWGTEHAPEIDPNVAGQITILKGAGGVRYGPEAIGGAILIEPAPLRDSAGIGGNLNLSGFSNGRTGAGSAKIDFNPGGKMRSFAGRIQGSVRKGGNSRTPACFISNSGLEEKNFSAACGWTATSFGVDAYYSQFNSRIGVFSGSHIGNLTDLRSAIQSDTPLVNSGFTYSIGRPYQNIGHELTKFSGYLQARDHSRLILMASRQYNLREEFDADGENDDPASAGFRLTTHSGEILYEHEKFHGFKGQIGASDQEQKNTWSGNYLVPNFRSSSRGVFLLERWVGIRLELEAGIRYDNKQLETFRFEGDSVLRDEFQWSRMSGSAGGLIRLSPHFHIRANMGSAWRPPAIQELYSDGLHHGAAAYESGSINLLPEKSIKSVLTMNYEGHEKIELEFTAYHNSIRDYIYLQPVQPPVLTVRGAFPAFEYRQTDAVFAGSDAMISWSPLERLNLRSTGSVLRVRAPAPDRFLPGIPSDRFSFAIGKEFPSLNHLLKPELTLAARHVRRQTRYVTGSDYLDPPPGYTLLDFEAKTSLVFGKQEIHLYFGALNLLNQKYRDYMDRFRYFTDAVGRNITFRIVVPILPG